MQSEAKREDAGQAAMHSTEGTERASRCAWASRHWEPCVVASALVLGVVGGLALQGVALSQRHLSYLAFPGEAYTRMLAMLFLPLKVSCLVGSIGSTSYRTGGKLLRCALAYWVLSASSAAMVAFGTTMLLRGVRNETVSALQLTPIAQLNISAVQTTDLAMDMIRGLFPPNIVDVSMRTWPSQFSPRGSELWADDPRKLCLDPKHVEADTPGAPHTRHPLRRVSGLGLLSSAVALGFVLAHNADDRNVLLNFFINLSNAIAAVGRVLSWFLPVGLASLTATRVMTIASALRSTQSLSLLLTYSLNVVVAVMVHTFIVLPIIQWILVQHWKRGLLRFFGQTYVPLVVSGATGSTAASLALGVSVLEIKSGLDARVVRTVLPAGVVLGRSGSVAHLMVSLLFIAHLHRAKIEGWDLVGTGANAVVASLTDAGVSPALVTVLLGGEAGLGDPIIHTAQSVLGWLTAMADMYGSCVAATVCYDSVEEDLSEDDVYGSDEG